MAKQPSPKSNFNSKNQGLRTHPAMQAGTTVKKVFMSINATNNHVATADHELEKLQSASFSELGPSALQRWLGWLEA